MNQIESFCFSGPPGVGKSTLAHIVARLCGYRPLEVNGSDERSTSVLKERILRTMESNTLDLSSEKGKARPKCLILDCCGRVTSAANIAQGRGL